MSDRLAATAASDELYDQLTAFGPVVREAMLRANGGRKDNCISAAKIALDVLRSIRVDAYALRVQLSVFNEAFVKRVDAEGRMPEGQAEVVKWGAECGAWSVGVGITDVPLAPDRWPGHLVVIANRHWLWDLSIDQADRPQYAMVFPTPVLLPVTEAFLRGRERLSEEWAGMIVVYEARPEDKSFRTAPDWLNTSTIVNGVQVK